MTRLALMIALLCPLAAHAQGTEQEYSACKADATHHCAAEVAQLKSASALTAWAYRLAVGKCLVGNKAKISNACRDVLAAHGL